MISRRKLPGLLLAALLQPDYPPTQPEQRPEVVLSDAEFQLYASILFDVLLQSNFNLWQEVKRLQWLSPGPDLYTNQEGDT